MQYLTTWCIVFSRTRGYLNKRRIRATDTHASTLRFVLASSSVEMFDLRDSTCGWGLILFNGRSTLKEADFVELAAVVNAVFNK